MSYLELDFDKDIAGFEDKQLEALDILDSGKCKYFLYGGAAGGGKSYLLRWWAIRRLMELGKMGYRGVTGMLACETYPDLKRRQLTKMESQFPSWIGKIHSDHAAHGNCFLLNPEYGGGVLLLCNLDDPSKYSSVEFAFVCVDELTKNAYYIFDDLRTRLRWHGIPDVECQFVGATNPTGVGMGWVKQLFIDRAFPPQFKEPEDITRQFYFLQSLAKDNPHIDPNYALRMSTYSEEMRAALRDGRWDTFAGQAFPEVNEVSHGLGKIVPDKIARNWQIYMTFDYGYGVPFSVGWWYVDNDGRCIRFDEWYGWNGTPNKGLNMPLGDIADGIKAKEKEMKIDQRDIIRLAGHDCGSKHANPYGTTKGKSAVEVFADHGLHLILSDPDRIAGVRQFRDRIRTKIDNKPMLMASTNCVHFFRTIPTLITKLDGPGALEDVDNSKGAEDHVYEDSRMILAFRPMTPEAAEWDESTIPGKGWKNLNHLSDDFNEADRGGGYDFYGNGLSEYDN